MHCRNMKTKDTQEVFFKSSFKLCIYIKIRNGFSHHCMKAILNFHFNFTLPFLCTKEQYDGLDRHRNKCCQREREFITFIVCNCKHERLWPMKRKEAKRNSFRWSQRSYNGKSHAFSADLWSLLNALERINTFPRLKALQTLSKDDFCKKSKREFIPFYWLVRTVLYKFIL